MCVCVYVSVCVGFGFVSVCLFLCARLLSSLNSLELPGNSPDLFCNIYLYTYPIFPKFLEVGGEDKRFDNNLLNVLL